MNEWKNALLDEQMGKDESVVGWMETVHGQELPCVFFFLGLVVFLYPCVSLFSLGKCTEGRRKAARAGVLVVEVREGETAQKRYVVEGKVEFYVLGSQPRDGGEKRQKGRNREKKKKKVTVHCFYN